MKRLLLALYVLSACLLPCTAAFLVIAFNSVGMGPFFVTAITIENWTQEEIRVTPIGAVGRGGHRSRLPTCLFAYPAIPSYRDGDYRIPPGGSVRIHYDADDINFSEIVVIDSKGRTRQLVVDPEPLKNQYHAPKSDHFVIETLDTLSEPPPEVRRPVEKKSAVWRIWLVMLIGIVAVPSFVVSRRAYRVHARKSNSAAGAGS